MKIFLDANILFSAADPASATHRLLTFSAHRAMLITSPHAWEEARRNLQHKRPQYLPGLEALHATVTVSHAFSLPPPGTDLPLCDIPILAGAIGAGCTCLWTSDKRHFGRYFGKDLAGVRVVSSLLLTELL